MPGTALEIEETLAPMTRAALRPPYPLWTHATALLARTAWRSHPLRGPLPLQPPSLTPSWRAHGQLTETYAGVPVRLAPLGGAPYRLWAAIQEALRGSRAP